MCEIVSEDTIKSDDLTENVTEEGKILRKKMCRVLEWRGIDQNSFY